MATIDRRTFLTQTVGGVAASTALGALAGRAVAAPAQKYSVAIVGCGRMGQQYAEIYNALPDTEVVAIAEWNDERRGVVGKRFGVAALYKEASALFKDVVPDIAIVATPTKFMRDAIVMAAEAGVKGVQVERPMAARLSDADAMVEACKTRGVKFGGGGIERSKWEVELTGRWLQEGKFGKIVGAVVRHYRSPIGCQACRTSVLRHFTGAEVEEVIAWGSPVEALRTEVTDSPLLINGIFQLSNGIQCPVFGSEGAKVEVEEGLPGVEVWTDEDVLVRWNRHGGPPFLYKGKMASGARKPLDPQFPPHPYAEELKLLAPLLDRIHNVGTERDYLLAPCWALVDAIRNGTDPWISGNDLRRALEIAIACKISAQLGNAPVKLPLQDRSHTFYPKPYRWVGGDDAGRPQSTKEAAGPKC